MAQQLLERIADGTWPPGSRLPAEAELCAEMGVSRVTLREAVKSLQQRGVVSVEQGRGSFVTAAGQWSPFDPMLLAARTAGTDGPDSTWGEKLLELRRMVEVGVAGLAAQRRTDEDLAAMQGHLDVMQEARAAGDVRAFAEADLAFHDAVMAAARNELIAALFDPISQLVHQGRLATSRTDDRQAHALEAHRDIHRAVADADAEAASTAMRRHLDNTFVFVAGGMVPGDAPVKALRWHAAGDVRLDDVEPPPPPGPGQIQLRVTACGICGTDVEEWREGPMLIPVDVPQPLTGAVAPLTLGHEVAGEVAAAGPGVDLAVGAAVAVDGLVTCGVCRECRRGRPNLCPQQGQVGLMADGGLQPLVNVPALSCLAVPGAMAPEAAALAETLSVAVRALHRARLEPGDRVAVFGGGAVGLLTVQAARAMGAGRVTLFEPLASRRALGASLGADEAVAPADLDLPDPDGDGPGGGRPVGSGEDAVDGAGFDVVVECSGVPAAVRGAVAVARRAGRIALVGINSARPPLDTWDVVSREKEIIGSFSHVREQDFAGALGMLAGTAISLDGLVTRVPLARSLDDGLLALARHPEDHLKIVVVPDDAR